ncbi:transcriptional regulator, AraC family [Chitinophaga jiangningensis]|uniref:Transcriptional regulator, AraC family n=1 Tax=Chitinophaga jiangningensis TaxID=1419482 RepID=A0A1M7N259_9BACT|nr:helix-turn-helix domain-containing protein [Chitinophaga jiangningensis]SHM97489.1 transcriptional regulator, AraC family [Chitinophaga jiangningensis]
MTRSSLENFYRETTGKMPEGVNKELGHFNVFKIADTITAFKNTGVMPYNRRSYYKISMISGRNRAEYADKVIEIENNALLFASPKIPYHYVPQDENQSGYFCIFTEEFLVPTKSGVVLDELPIFKSGEVPIFKVNEEEAEEITGIFKKMYREISSDYAFKYDLLRTYLMEVIHFGQKLQPLGTTQPAHSAATRISSLFIELLERQFPVEPPQQRLQLRTAKDFADRLAVHVNHLNKVLKENTGKTTTELISSRIVQEAKILLKQTNLSISEIAYGLGFEEVAHFSNFFRKQTNISPAGYR